MYFKRILLLLMLLVGSTQMYAQCDCLFALQQDDGKMVHSFDAMDGTLLDSEPQTVFNRAYGLTVIKNFNGDVNDDRVYVISGKGVTAGQLAWYSVDDMTCEITSGANIVSCGVPGQTLPDDNYPRMVYIEGQTGVWAGYNGYFLVGQREGGKFYFVNPETGCYDYGPFVASPFEDDMGNPVSSIGGDVALDPITGKIYLVTKEEGTLPSGVFEMSFSASSTDFVLDFISYATDGSGHNLHATGLTFLGDGSMLISVNNVSPLIPGQNGGLYRYNFASNTAYLIPGTEGNKLNDLGSFPTDVHINVDIIDFNPVAPATGNPYMTGEQFTYTVEVSNIGVEHTSEDLVLCVPIPSEFALVSSSASTGTYNDGNCEWIIADPLTSGDGFDPGATATLTLTLEVSPVSANSNIYLSAEVISSCPDYNSTANNFTPNGNPADDEDDEAEITVQIVDVFLSFTGCEIVYGVNAGDDNLYNYDYLTNTTILNTNLGTGGSVYANTVIPDFGGTDSDDRVYYIDSDNGNLYYIQIDDETGQATGVPTLVPCSCPGDCLSDIATNPNFPKLAYIENTVSPYNGMLLAGTNQTDNNQFYIVDPATACVTDGPLTFGPYSDGTNSLHPNGGDVAFDANGTLYLLTNASNNACTTKGGLFTVDLNTGQLTYLATAEDALGNCIRTTGIVVLSDGTILISTSNNTGNPGNDGSYYLYDPVTNTFNPVPSSSGVNINDLGDLPLPVDLELNITGPTPIPPATGTPYQTGDQFTYTVTVENRSNYHASEVVEACVPIPVGFTVISSTASTGSYDPISCQWLISDINVGGDGLKPLQAVTLDIVLELEPVAFPSNQVIFEAQIVDSCPDIDSTPDDFVPNGNSTDDDDDEEEFIITIETPVIGFVGCEFIYGVSNQDEEFYLIDPIGGSYTTIVHYGIASDLFANTVIADWNGNVNDDRVYGITSSPNGGELYYFQIDDITGAAITPVIQVPCATTCTSCLSDVPLDQANFPKMAYITNSGTFADGNFLIGSNESGVYNYYVIDPANACVLNSFTIASSQYVNGSGAQHSAQGGDVAVDAAGNIYVATIASGGNPGGIWQMDIATQTLTFVATLVDGSGAGIDANGLVVTSTNDFIISTANGGQLYVYDNNLMAFAPIAGTGGISVNDLGSMVLEVDINLEITAGPDPVPPAVGSPYIPGDKLTYTVEVTNESLQHAAEALVVSVPIPADMTLVSSSASSGSYNDITGEWVIADPAILGDALMPGSAPVTLEIIVEVGNIQGSETINFTAQVIDSCPDEDSVPDNFVPDGDDTGDEDDEDEFVIDVVGLPPGSIVLSECDFIYGTNNH